MGNDPIATESPKVDALWQATPDHGELTVGSDIIALEDAVAYVAAQCKHRGVSLMRTKLVKLLYFVVFRTWESFGRTIAGVEWMWHNYGPFSASTAAPCERMEVNGKLRTRTSEKYFEAPQYHIDPTTTGTTRYYATVDQLILERVTRHNLNRHFQLQD